MGLSSVAGIAASGLASNTAALDVTGQNVSNVNTPGYTRRIVNLQDSITGGVLAGNAMRVFDQFSASRMITTQSGAGAAGARDDAMTAVQSLFNDTNASGLGDSMSALFSSFSALASSPDDPTARASVLSAADSFAGQVRGVAGALAAQKTDLLAQAKSTSDEINGITSQIASLNSAIGSSKANGADTSDLEDKRQSLVSDLSQRIDAKVITDPTGQITVLSAGTSLVSGATATKLNVDLDANGNTRVMASTGASAGNDITANISGGKLAGTIRARDQDLAAVSQKLDALVTDVAGAVNTQHEAGYGSDGVTGRALFSFSAGPGSAATLQVDAAMQGHPERVAAAGDPTAAPGDSTNATALADLSSALVGGGGTETPAAAYGDIVGFVGLTKQSTAREADVQPGLFPPPKTMNDSSSGVSLDEEMANLSMYQRAYQATAQVLKAADDLLAGLMVPGAL
jgi:flagellar hook-associated protein 1 FlgK